MLQRFQCQLLGLRFVHVLAVNQAFRHILQSRAIREEVVVLEDKTHLAAQGCDLAAARAVHVHGHIVEFHRAVVGALEKFHTAKKRRLPRAAGAENDDDVSLIDREADPAEDLLSVKALMKISDF